MLGIPGVAGPFADISLRHCQLVRVERLKSQGEVFHQQESFLVIAVPHGRHGRVAAVHHHIVGALEFASFKRGIGCGSDTGELEVVFHHPWIVVEQLFGVPCLKTNLGDKITIADERKSLRVGM